MATMKDTKMQPATDAVIEELRKVIADCYWPTSPVTIKELLDRLEAAEKDVTLKERVIDALGSELNAVANERDALRAKIEAMERQEPAGTLHDDGCFVWRETAPHQSNYAGWKMALYALPGAKGE